MFVCMALKSVGILMEISAICSGKGLPPMQVICCLLGHLLCLRRNRFFLLGFVFRTSQHNVRIALSERQQTVFWN